MFHDVWELERFQTAKVTFKGTGNGVIWGSTHDFLLVFHSSYVSILRHFWGFTAFSLPAQFAPRSESPIGPWPSLERNGWPFCSREQKFLQTFAPRNFGSRNFPSVNPEHYYAICDLQPLDGSAAAACRTYQLAFNNLRDGLPDDMDEGMTALVTWVNDN